MGKRQQLFAAISSFCRTQRGSDYGYKYANRLDLCMILRGLAGTHEAQLLTQVKSLVFPLWKELYFPLGTSLLGLNFIQLQLQLLPD